MEQEPIRGAQPRSSVGSYVSSDLMLWQALCACFPALFIFFPLFSEITSITLARHQKEIMKQEECVSIA